MKLYYGLTNYHLLCSILHKFIYNPKEKAIFVASQGILENRIEALRKSRIFEEVYYLEDTNVRNFYFNQLSNKSSSREIKEIADKFTAEYKEILPFNVEEFSDIYLAADHGVLGIYILIKRIPYNYLEDGRGIYSNWKILDNLLKIKNPGIQIMSLYYNAYGKSELIKEKFIAFDSQKEECKLIDCKDFDINILLDKIGEKELNKIFDVFNVRNYKKNSKEKKALVLTQRFSAYNMLQQDDCILMYALLCDFFSRDCEIYLKPHPADKCVYDNVFKNAILLEKELPSELIRYIINNKFDIGISTYSSSINSLKPYIKKIYNIDDSVVQFKNNIFKLYVLFELAKAMKTIVINEEELLEQLFERCYDLKQYNRYILNFSDKEIKDSIMVKYNYFKGANCIIKICKNIENDFISKDLLNRNEYLYMNIDNSKMKKNIINFKIDNILPISKVHISAYIDEI